MEPLTSKYDRYPTHLSKFNKDTAGHVMTVAHDDGLYRHLQFRRPETGMYWFDIHTTPGTLTVTGDMGTYMFARTPDMFTWFSTEEINPGYWSEKLRAANYGRYDGGSVRAYEAAEFKTWVFDRFWQDSRDMDADQAAKAWRLIRENIFEGWYTNNKSTPDSENEAVDKIRDFHDHHDNDTGFEFYDWGDAVSGWQEFTLHYLWNCYAIVAAIRAYRNHKEGTTE